MKDIRLDQSRSCASALECFPIQGGMSSKRSWVKGRKISMATLNNGDKRHVAPVRYMQYKNFRTGLMDCITGTLYQNGLPMSSDQLSIQSVDDADHTGSLLAKKGINWGDKLW